MYFAHGPISYLANEVIQKKKIKHLKMHEQILVALSSLFFGILPDLDILVLSVFGAPRFIHHDIITHTPIFYIAIWVVLRGGIYFSNRIFNKKTDKALNKRLLNILADTFLIATLFHLIADFVVDSIMIFYPISDFRFYIFKFIFEQNIFAGIPFSFVFALEIFFISIFLYAVYKKFFKNNKIVTILLQTLMVLTTIYIPFVVYVSLNTYNSSHMYGSDGKLNYDIDYDGVRDSVDMYVGNTGQNNLQRAKPEDVLDSALNIVNSNKWTGFHENSVLARIKYLYGGFDSYRLVAQTYYDIHLPIGPVLRDFHIKNYGFESYFYSDFDYPNLLLNYLGVNDRLLELNLDATIVDLEYGKIFFVMEEEKVVNLGITLRDNFLAIVLETDENLTMHSYEALREYYGERISNIYIQK